MKVRITETHTDFVQGLIAFLKKDFGAVPTQDPLVFEVSTALNPEAIYGIEVVNQHAEHDLKIAGAWLEAYTGTFDFYLSLKSQWEKKGSLSPKQIDAVKRAIERDHAPRVQKQFSLSPGQVLVVGKWLAREIAQKANFVRPHHAFEVISVEAETEGAYKLALRFSAQKTAHCSLCGLALTNPESVHAGVGPVCAKRVGVSFGKTSLDEIKEQLKQTVVVNTWIPKRSIKEIK